MSEQTIEALALSEARKLAEHAPTWADLSNAISSPSGLLVKLFRTRAEREAFLSTPEYAAIQELIHESMLRTGLIAGANPTIKPKGDRAAHGLICRSVRIFDSDQRTEVAKRDNKTAPDASRSSGAG